MVNLLKSIIYCSLTVGSSKHVNAIVVDYHILYNKYDIRIDTVKAATGTDSDLSVQEALSSIIFYRWRGRDKLRYLFTFFF